MQLDYQTFGDPTNHPIVLIHPFPFSAEIWRTVASDLSAAGYYVITPNLRGCGGTELGNSDHADPDLDLLAQDILDLVSELDLVKPTIGGISLGGYVVMAILRKNKDVTDSVIFLDTKASADTVEAKANRFKVANQMRAFGKVDLFAEQMLANLIGDVTKTNKPEVTHQVLDWMKSTKPETIAWLQEAMANRPDSFQALNEFPGRALLIRGSDDAISSKQDFANLQKNLRQATYVEISNTGHMPIVEDPAAVTAIIRRWLAENLVS